MAIDGAIMLATGLMPQSFARSMDIAGWRRARRQGATSFHAPGMSRRAGCSTDAIHVRLSHRCAGAECWRVRPNEVWWIGSPPLPRADLASLSRRAPFVQYAAFIQLQIS